MLDDIDRPSIVLVLAALAIFPILATFYFQLVVKSRKRHDILATMERHGAWKTKDLPDVRTVREENVQKEFDEYYRTSSFALPVLYLTFLYTVAAWVAAAFFANLGDDGPWPFAAGFIARVPPVLLAVFGVYLFNMQHTLRRVYLSDLTPSVFWAGIYRTLLVVGLSIVLAFGFGPDAPITDHLGPWFYFAIGFLATDVLAAILVFSQRSLRRLFQWGEGQIAEKPLTLVQGINLWNAYRLEEEGIDNVQHLSTCDVISLSLKTHYELNTLIDWVDQAILLHHLGTIEQAKKLQTEGLLNSAIDLAWLSDDNDDDNEVNVKRIATILVVEDCDVRQMMDSLYEDENVRFLWFLWQSRRDFGKGTKKQADASEHHKGA
jgi:hypothetical protein